MNYDTESTATVVVDMQNDFCHPDGALYAEGSEEAIEGVNEVISQTEGQIWYTLDTHEPGDPEFEKWGEHCLEGSWGHELHDDVIKCCPSNAVWKNSYDAFHETGFNEALQDEGIETLIICGTLANVCVQETASSALNHIEFLIGDVISTEDL